MLSESTAALHSFWSNAECHQGQANSTKGQDDGGVFKWDKQSESCVAAQWGICWAHGVKILKTVYVLRSSPKCCSLVHSLILIHLLMVQKRTLPCPLFSSSQPVVQIRSSPCDSQGSISSWKAFKRKNYPWKFKCKTHFPTSDEYWLAIGK